MDDPLFVREESTGEGNLMGKFLPFIAIGLVIAGILGLIAILGGNGAETENNQNTVATSEDEQLDTNESGSESETASETNEDNEVDDNSETMDSDADETVSESEASADETGSDDNTLGPPADDSLVNVYYIGENGEPLAVALEKPESNVLNFVINQVFLGPEGNKTWSFANDSNCGANRTYSYSISGTRLNVELCRSIQGNASDFVEAMHYTATEQDETPVSEVAVLSKDGNCLSSSDLNACN